MSQAETQPLQGPQKEGMQYIGAIHGDAIASETLPALEMLIDLDMLLMNTCVHVPGKTGAASNTSLNTYSARNQVTPEAVQESSWPDSLHARRRRLSHTLPPQGWVVVSRKERSNMPAYYDQISAPSHIQALVEYEISNVESIHRLAERESTPERSWCDTLTW